MPFEGPDGLRWSVCACHLGPTSPLIMCGSGRAEPGGNRGDEAREPIARVVDGPNPINAHPGPREMLLFMLHLSSQHSLPSPFMKMGRKEGHSFIRLPGRVSAASLYCSLDPGPSPYVSDTCIIALNPPVPSLNNSFFFLSHKPAFLSGMA
jgi:hypothetical protein